MKFNIFNRPVLVLTAFIALSTPNFAQEAPARPAPPMPPVPPAVNIEINGPDVDVQTNFDEKAFNQSMKKLNLNLNNLSVKLKGLDSQTMTLSMKDFGNDLKVNLNDLTLNFFEGIKNIGSTINLDLKNLDLNSTDIDDNDVKLSSPYSQEELKEKIKSGAVSEKVKAFSKTYTVDANDKLLLDNRYGKIIVNTWNKNMVKVDVEIKAESGNDANSQKMLDAVQIRDSKEGNQVSFVTKITDDWNSGSFSWSGLTKVRKIEINYIVYMPAKMPLQVTNRYGGTELPDLDGPVIVNASYGSLTAKSLSNANNQIRVSYGSASIASLGSSDINVSYGSLDLGTVDQINANVSYGSAKIGKISTSGNISIKFSSPLLINDLDRGLKSLSVNSSYSGVKLGLSGDENADFDVTVKNGSFDYHDGVSITSKTPPDNARGWSPTKNYKGHVGKGNADKMITITTSFGSVKFD